MYRKEHVMETACNKNANRSRSQIRLHCHSYHKFKYLSQCMRVFFRCSLSTLTSYFSLLISSVTTSCCACSDIMRIQSSTARTVVINAFQIFYIFFRAVSDVQLPIMFIFKSSKSGLTFAITYIV